MLSEIELDKKKDEPSVKPRVVETNEIVQGEFTVEVYDLMMRNSRDKGWIETEFVLKMGINHGMCLEVG
jgi:ubiquinone/menaquinone biosynthesis C-methylase UbiE